MQIAVDSLDDALQIAYKTVLSSGEKVVSTRGSNRELIGLEIKISNPLARLSLAESRATLFSCIGELVWYLAGSDELNFISHYIPKYTNYVSANDGHVAGAYGPRLFNWNGYNHVQRVIKLLGKRESSRRAIIQMISPNDLKTHGDIPCTNTLQFLVRNNRLNMITTMRSNDACRGFPHDVFVFTMLQEVIAKSLRLDLGEYHHWVGSFHIYDEDENIATRLIDEGWQQTVGGSMPAMPESPWSAINHLLIEEKIIRENKKINKFNSTKTHYWDDLIRILLIHRFLKDKDIENARYHIGKLHSKYFVPFAQERITKNL